MEIEINWIALGITAFMIVVVAGVQLWREFQKGWGDLHVEKAEYNGDITDMIPLVMKRSDEKFPYWE